jgi:hypothetical protein
MISRLWREVPRGDPLSDPGGVMVDSQGRLQPLESPSKSEGPEAPPERDFLPVPHAQVRYAPGYSLAPLRGEFGSSCERNR